jgi:hypothetical protein
VQKIGNRVKITARLSRAATNDPRQITFSTSVEF